MKNITSLTQFTVTVLFAPILSYLIYGCTSMQPLDDETRAFLNGTPGAVCNYPVEIETKDSSKHATLYNAKIDVAHDELILRENYRGDTWVDTSITIPERTISRFRFDGAIEVTTRDNSVFETNRGDWNIHPVNESSSYWQLSAKPYRLNGSLKQCDTTIAEKDIRKIEIDKSDLGRTLLLTTSIAAIGIILLVYLLVKSLQSPLSFLPEK